MSHDRDTCEYGCYLTAEQVDQLLKAINPLRVGKDGKGFSHTQGYDITAHLTRILGFARWSQEVTDLTLAFDDEKDGRFTVCYRSTKRLTVCAPCGTQLAVYEESATGDAPNQRSRSDAHDMALKTANTQALKRCAIALGDQYGLGLYAGGSTKAIIGRTLIMPGERPAQAVADVSEHITEQLAPEDSPAGPAEEAPVSAAPARQADDPVTEIRDKALAATKKAELMRLLMECGRLQIGGAMTTDGDGNGVLLEALINQCIKTLGRAA